MEDPDGEEVRLSLFKGDCLSHGCQSARISQTLNIVTPRRPEAAASDCCPGAMIRIGAWTSCLWTLPALPHLGGWRIQQLHQRRTDGMLQALPGKLLAGIPWKSVFRGGGNCGLGGMGPDSPSTPPPPTPVQPLLLILLVPKAFLPYEGSGTNLYLSAVLLTALHL